MADFNVVNVIFCDFPSNRAKTKLNKADITYSKGKRLPNTDELVYEINPPSDNFNRIDVIELGAKVKITIQHNIPRGSSPIATKILFNTSAEVANTWMFDLAITKARRGGRQRKGDLRGWVSYPLVEKGIGRNKKLCRVGGKLGLYIASKGN